MWSNPGKAQTPVPDETAGNFSNHLKNSLQARRSALYKIQADQQSHHPVFECRFFAGRAANGCYRIIYSGSPGSSCYNSFQDLSELRVYGKTSLTWSPDQILSSHFFL